MNIELSQDKDTGKWVVSIVGGGQQATKTFDIKEEAQLSYFTLCQNYIDSLGVN